MPGDSRMRSFARQVSYEAAPAGTVHPYAGAVLPDGYLWCRGGTFNKNDYPNLYAALGNSTTLPDYRGRTLIGAGQGPGLANRTLGADGGAENVTLAAGELPAHTHGTAGSHIHSMDSAGGHEHTVYANQRNDGVHSGIYNFLANLQDTTGGGDQSQTSFSGAHVHTINSDGSHAHSTVGNNESHNNMQPWAAINFIIRT
jgi:microcystin-dependent protein